MRTILFCTIIVIVLFFASFLTVFEDGSWTYGPISGCIPGAICND